MDCTKYPFTMACRGVTSLVKRRPVSFVKGRHLEDWRSGQKHLQPPMDLLETGRERIGRTKMKKKTQENKVGTLWSLFPHPPGKRQMTSGLFSNILSSWDEAKMKDNDLDLSMLMGGAEVEEKEMLDRSGRTSFSKTFSPTCSHSKLWLYQECLGKQDFKGSFPQEMALPRKRG